MSLFPPFFGFNVDVHDRITRQVSQIHFACGKGCQEFLGEVQARVDSRFGEGEKSDATLYLHYIQPVFGYTSSARRWVAGALGVLRPRFEATADDFVALSEKRAFEVIVQIIGGARGRLNHHETGQILYLLGTLIHAHQDRKHMEANWFSLPGLSINPFQHCFTEFHQVITDANPPMEMEHRALRRTVNFLIRFREKMVKDMGLTTAQEAFSSLRDFRRIPGWEIQRYKPSPQVMDYVFPEYPSGDAPF